MECNLCEERGHLFDSCTCEVRHRYDHPALSSTQLLVAASATFHLIDTPPRHKRQASDIDVAFPAGNGDDHLLKELHRVLPNEFALHPPDLVLYGEAEREGRVAAAWDLVGQLRRADAALAASFISLFFRRLLRWFGRGHRLGFPFPFLILTVVTLAGA